MKKQAPICYGKVIGRAMASMLMKEVWIVWIHPDCDDKQVKALGHTSLKSLVQSLVIVAPKWLSDEYYIKPGRYIAIVKPDSSFKSETMAKAMYKLYKNRADFVKQ